MPKTKNPRVIDFSLRLLYINPAPPTEDEWWPMKIIDLYVYVQVFMFLFSFLSQNILFFIS